MKKWIVPMLFLLTVLLLVSLAFLPALAGVWQDVGVEKEVSYRPLHSIAPYISEKGSGLGFSEKLTVFQQSDISAIVPALASMTQEQVRTAVEEGIRPFVDAGVIRSVENWDFHATAHIAISWQDARQYFLFWDVSLVEVTGNSKCFLSLRLDDETGKFLDMRYHDRDTLADGALWEENCAQLDVFARIWLEQAGLWDIARSLKENTNAQFRGELPVMCARVYEIRDETAGSLYLYFSLASHGEFIIRLESMPQ